MSTFGVYENYSVAGGIPDGSNVIRPGRVLYGATQCLLVRIERDSELLRYDYSYRYSQERAAELRALFELRTIQQQPVAMGDEQPVAVNLIADDDRGRGHTQTHRRGINGDSPNRPLRLTQRAPCSRMIVRAGLRKLKRIAGK